MPQARFTLPFALLPLSLAILAQTGAVPPKGASVNPDDRVLNVPYSAQRLFISISKGADGTSSRSESGGSEARDSQGRTYSSGERDWTYLAGGKTVLKSEMLYRIHDPVANTDTRWDSTSKEVKVIHYPQSAREENASQGQCPAECLEDTMKALGNEFEKLGTKTIEGVVAEGKRSSYTVSAGQDHNDHAIAVVHETWYCPELKIVILETNDDPRSGRTTNQLVSIVRGEPDISKYHPPADYVVHDIQIPW